MIIGSGTAISQPVSYMAEYGTEHPTDPKAEKSYFEFYADHELKYIEDQFDEIDLSLVRKHKLGEEVALYLHLLDQEYTYVTEAAPGSFSGRMVIQKPTIYNSINRIDKYFRKQIRKGLATEEQARNELIRTAEIALILLHKDSSEFEKALEKSKTDEKLLSLYSRIKIKKY